MDRRLHCTESQLGRLKLWATFSLSMVCLGKNGSHFITRITLCQSSWQITRRSDCTENSNGSLGTLIPRSNHHFQGRMCPRTTCKWEGSQHPPSIRYIRCSATPPGDTTSCCDWDRSFLQGSLIERCLWGRNSRFRGHTCQDLPQQTQ